VNFLRNAKIGWPGRPVRAAGSRSDKKPRNDVPVGYVASFHKSDN